MGQPTCKRTGSRKSLPGRPSAPRPRFPNDRAWGRAPPSPVPTRSCCRRGRGGPGPSRRRHPVFAARREYQVFPTRAPSASALRSGQCASCRDAAALGRRRRGPCTSSRGGTSSRRARHWAGAQRASATRRPSCRARHPAGRGVFSPYALRRAKKKLPRHPSGRPALWRMVRAPRWTADLRVGREELNGAPDAPQACPTLEHCTRASARRLCGPSGTFFPPARNYPRPLATGGPRRGAAVGSRRPTKVDLPAGDAPLVLGRALRTSQNPEHRLRAPQLAGLAGAAVVRKRLATEPSEPPPGGRSSPGPNCPWSEWFPPTSRPH